MIEVNLKPIWLFSNGNEQAYELLILNLLQAIVEHGKLTAAARQVGLSYRHAWNMLERWETFFGKPLVEMHKGRGARLSALGEKILWAEKRVQARLTAQITNLASELEVEINRVLSGTHHVVRLHASHGYAVAELRQQLHQNSMVQLDLQYRGSIEALQDVCRGDCDLAGFHVPEGPLGQAALGRFAYLLKPAKYRIIHFVTRRQGLIVRRGNPLEVRGLKDLARPGLRFVNREATSGTRLLFDLLLEQAGVASNQVPGYQKEELTHNAVAAFVASDMADIGFGVEAAARQFNLDFIPLNTEQYYLMCRQETLDKPGIIELLRLVQRDTFRAAIARIPGYDASRAGEVRTLPEEFPSLR
jgi:putative molybdopterin biosynthesis protein